MRRELERLNKSEGKGIHSMECASVVFKSVLFNRTLMVNPLSVCFRQQYQQ